MLFLEQFEENVERAGEALDNNGFDLEGYAVCIYDDDSLDHGVTADSIRSSYRETVDDLKSGHWYTIRSPGSRLADCFTGEGGVEDLLRRNVAAQVVLDEPLVERTGGGRDYQELAYHTVVHYDPVIEKDPVFEIKNITVRHPYDEEDGTERLEKIAEILEAEDFEVRNEGNLGRERDPDKYSDYS